VRGRSARVRFGESGYQAAAIPKIPPANTANGALPTAVRLPAVEENPTAGVLATGSNLPCSHVLDMTDPKTTYPRDIHDWDEHRLHVDALDELDDIEKHEAKHAFEYLQNILGKNFLRKLESVRITSGQTHPFMAYLLNYAGWTRRYLTRLANAMRLLEGSENLDGVILQLEEPERFSHNMLLLESSAKLVREGLQVAFEPTLPVGDRRKQPDARFLSEETKETVFLEVAIQQSARQSIEAFQAMNTVTWRFMAMPFGFRWAGRLSKIPAPPHMADIMAKADRAIERATKEKRFVELVEQGTIEIAVCPEDQIALLEKWSNPRGLQPGGFEGPPYDENILARLKRKIQTEQSQLPADKPNAILIDATDLFFRIRDIRAVMNELEEEVYKHPHVPLVVIVGSHISGAAPELVQKDEHRYTRRAVDPLYTEDNLLLFNRYSPAKLSTSLLSKFLRAF